MAIKLQPLGDRVLVHPLEEQRNPARRDHHPRHRQRKTPGGRSRRHRHRQDRRRRQEASLHRQGRRPRAHQQIRRHGGQGGRRVLPDHARRRCARHPRLNPSSHQTPTFGHTRNTHKRLWQRNNYNSMNTPGRPSCAAWRNWRARSRRRLGRRAATSSWTRSSGAPPSPRTA